MKKSIRRTPKKYSFTELVNIMARLRGPEGCPWDKHQDHRTLLKHLFSEAHEVKQAINNNDFENLKEELGDILLQVIFHSRIAEENGRFNIADVVDVICQKLIRRHPHVFGNEKLKTADDVIRRWEEIKKQEKRTIWKSKKLNQK